MNQKVGLVYDFFKSKTDELLLLAEAMREDGPLYLAWLRYSEQIIDECRHAEQVHATALKLLVLQGNLVGLLAGFGRESIQHAPDLYSELVQKLEQKVKVG